MIAVRRVRVEGVDATISAVVAATLSDMHTEVEAGAQMLEDAIKQKLRGPRSGEIDLLGGIPSRRSAPGEAPAFREGELHDSVTHTAPVVTGNAVKAEVGPTADHAEVLEVGGISDTGGRILPRPYFRPSVQETGPKIIARWRRNLS